MLDLTVRTILRFLLFPLKIQFIFNYRHKPKGNKRWGLLYNNLEKSKFGFIKNFYLRDIYAFNV